MITLKSNLAVKWVPGSYLQEWRWGVTLRNMGCPEAAASPNRGDGSGKLAPWRSPENLEFFLLLQRWGGRFFVHLVSLTNFLSFLSCSLSETNEPQFRTFWVPRSFCSEEIATQHSSHVFFCPVSLSPCLGNVTQIPNLFLFPHFVGRLRKNSEEKR